MAAARYPPDVYGLETRYSNPFMSLTNVQDNGQGAVEAYERRAEGKCEHYNPFLCHESCAGTHANGGDLLTPADSPAQFAHTNPFFGADSESHGPTVGPGVYMPQFPAPNMLSEVCYADTNPFPLLIWGVLYIVCQLPPNQKQIHFV